MCSERMSDRIGTISHTVIHRYNRYTPSFIFLQLVGVVSFGRSKRYSLTPVVHKINIAITFRVVNSGVRRACLRFALNGVSSETTDPIIINKLTGMFFSAVFYKNGSGPLRTKWPTELKRKTFKRLLFWFSETSEPTLFELYMNSS